VTVAADVREAAEDFDGAGLDVVDFVGIGDGVDDFDCVDVFVCDADLSGVLVLVTDGDSDADALLEGLAFELLDAIGDLDELLETVDDFELRGDEDEDLDDVVVGVDIALSVVEALSKGDGEELGVESDDLVEVVDGLDEIVANTSSEGDADADPVELFEGKVVFVLETETVDVLLLDVVGEDDGVDTLFVAVVLGDDDDVLEEDVDGVADGVTDEDLLASGDGVDETDVVPDRVITPEPVGV